MNTATITDLVSDYLADCQARGLSSKTLHMSYGYPLRSVLLPWCVQEGVVDYSQLDQPTLTRLSTHLRTVGGVRGRLKPNTIHTYIKNINAMLNWANRPVDDEKGGAGLTLGARAKKGKLPRHDDIPVLSRQDIDRLEAAAERERDKLIVRVLADTGIRVGELIHLRVDDVAVERDGHPYLRVRGKTGERLVGIPHLHKRLLAYVRNGRKVSASDRLFLSALRQRGLTTYDPLTESGVQQLVRRLGVDALGLRCHPHLFRHSFITWQINRGTDLITLAKIVGHADLTMLQTTYSHLSPTDTYAAMERAFAAEGALNSGRS